MPKPRPIKPEMDMGPYLLTQPNPTANGPNPTQPMIFWTGVTQPNPTHIPEYITPQGYC